MENAEAYDLDVTEEGQTGEAPEVSPQEFIAFILQSENIAADLSDDQLAKISDDVITEYDIDVDSMSEWTEKMKKGVDLARLVKGEEKEYPFKNAANIKYPLVTSAALQFNARAYPAIVPSDQIVKAKTYGSDPEGKKAARAERVSSYMSWQLAAEIVEWEEETDKLLVQLPIVGTMVRKVWYDPVKDRACCRVIDAGNFVVNDRVKVLDSAPRASEKLPLYPDEIEERIRSGQFAKFEFDEGDNRDKTAPQMFIEQHRRVDLDEDGYPEPYIVTVHKETKTVVRIVADFEEADVTFEYSSQVQPMQMPGGMIVMQDVQTPVGIVSIRRGSYFIPYHFLPSMDGGFWGTGLGLLLGDISESVNTIINMMLDAGHYAAVGGGFIGKELRLKGGAQRMRPGEWKMVGASGADITKAIVPMTFPGPDATLFQLLGMLIEAGREIASVKDVMTGDGGAVGKNASPTTTLALIEQGMMVFTASYKRIFRSLKHEYRLLAKINARAVTPEKYNAFLDDSSPEGQQIRHDPKADFSVMDMDIEPVADPRSITKMQEAAKAQIVMQLAEQGLADKGAASRRIIEAMNIGNADELAPQPDPMQQMMQQMQMQAAQADLSDKMANIELTMAKVESERAKVMEIMAGVKTDQQRLALDGRKQRMDALMKLLENDRARLDTAIRGGLGAMAGKPGDAGNQAGAGGSNGTGQGSMFSGVLGGPTLAGM
ncbi:MAG: hypothetical protein Tp125DCM00d2C40298531_18 [Prokaryotic dsDNA virus sp.]|nr:MAG: hypothetical protein Tp125DCM00d2C40298531_18 [Prokaryotic dsDNA virus sp.]|tara:strand:+ start:39633 stop:41777 length:2145 start_codon:yes stop_codon:yes gene_type:complete